MKECTHADGLAEAHRNVILNETEVEIMVDVVPLTEPPPVVNSSTGMNAFGGLPESGNPASTHISDSTTVGGDEDSTAVLNRC